MKEEGERKYREVTEGNRREAFRKCHNIRKGGKVVECRMSNEERRLHEKSQKGIFGHTRRTLNVVNKMKDVDSMNNVKRAKVVKNYVKLLKESHFVKTESEVQGKKVRKVACETSRKDKKNCAQTKMIKSKTTNVNENLCWLCDNMIDSLQAKVQCECSKWYHVECMGVTEVDDILRNKSCVWMCCKCRGSN